MRETSVGSSGAGEGSSSGSRVGQFDDQMRDVISAEIVQNIVNQTPVIFGSVREAIMELLDNRLEAFRAGIVLGQFGARLEPDSYGSQGSISEGDPIFSSCHQGSGVSGAPCPQGSPLYDLVVAEVSRVVHKELPDIIKRVTNRLTEKLQDQTSGVQTIDGDDRVAQE